MEAIILAGGLGSRLRTIVSDVPKPMAPVNGRPFLEYLLDYWIAQGVTRVVLAVGYKAEIVQKHFGSSYRGVPLDYSVEQSLLGTGGGFLLATGRLRDGGPVLVLNGDTFFEVDLTSLSGYHRKKSANVTMVLAEVSQNSRYHGVVLDGESRVVRLEGGNGQMARCYINGGVYLLDRGVSKLVRFRVGVRSSFESDVLPSLLADQAKVYGYVSAGRFIDIGIPEDYVAASVVLAGN
jgi:D-glycero-alpha-D-manno-heptose 1-phosphate guanylyltransferase